jgi:hypothetical protein
MVDVVGRAVSFVVGAVREALGFVKMMKAESDAEHARRARQRELEDCLERKRRG